MIRQVTLIFLVFYVGLQPLTARERRQRPKELNIAIDRGKEALLRFLPELMKGNGGPDELGRLTLCMTALFKSGLPTDHEVVAPALEQMKSFAHGRTYSAACYLFALDAYWQAKRREWLEKNPEERAESEQVPNIVPKGPIREQMVAMVDKLLEGNGGTWHYTSRSGGDLSNTQFAALGLKVALLNEIPVPTKTLQEMVTALLKLQHPPQKRQKFGIVYKTPSWKNVTEGQLRPRRYVAGPAGWNYAVGQRAAATNAMTAAGLSSLIIASHALETRGAYPDELATEVDRAIAQGLSWITGKATGFFQRVRFYDLYSLEKLGDLAGIARFGNVDWYNRGVSAILRRQHRRDGTWKGEHDAKVDTSLALLFLTRATQPPLEVHGPQIQRTGGDNAAEESDLVHIPQVDGYVSTMVLFEFLRNTRDRNVLPLAEEAIKATPPDRVDELLAHLLSVWTKRKDPTSRFAREHAAKLSGIRRIKRKECEAVTADLHAIRNMQRIGVADGNELSRMLRDTRSPVVRLSALTVISRLGQVDTFEAVVSLLDDEKGRTSDRAEAILAGWTSWYREATDDDRGPDGDLNPQAKRDAWHAWWERHENAILPRWRLRMNVTVLARVGGTERGETALKELVAEGRAAIPPLLDALRRGEYSIHHIRALEAVSGKSLGIRESAWQSWWASTNGD